MIFEIGRGQRRMFLVSFCNPNISKKIGQKFRTVVNEKGTKGLRERIKYRFGNGFQKDVF